MERLETNFTADGSVPMSGELKYYDGSKTLAYPVPMSNAGFHNSVYRGKYLGTAVTDTQWTAIGNGTFEDLYIGDYWTIGRYQLPYCCIRLLLQNR